MTTLNRLLVFGLTNSRILQTRNYHGVKGIKRVFRQDLPKYKLNLNELKPLTQHLVEDDYTRDLRGEKVSIYKQYIPSNQNTNLLESMFVQDDIGKLLEIVGRNLETMNSFYIAVSFEAINDLLNLRPFEPSTVQVAPEFRKLCTKALVKLRYFESDELLKLTKCLASVGVSEKAFITQATLKMIKELINDFNTEELQALAVALNGFPKLVEDTNMRTIASAIQEILLLHNNNSPRQLSD